MMINTVHYCACLYLKPGKEATACARELLYVYVYIYCDANKWALSLSLSLLPHFTRGRPYSL